MVKASHGIQREILFIAGPHFLIMSPHLYVRVVHFLLCLSDNRSKSRHTGNPEDCLLSLSVDIDATHPRPTT
jgi:hypothetical protein